MLVELTQEIHEKFKFRWVNEITGHYDLDVVDGYDVFNHIRRDILNAYADPEDEGKLIDALIRLFDYIGASGINFEVGENETEAFTSLNQYRNAMKKALPDLTFSPFHFHKLLTVIDMYVTVAVGNGPFRDGAELMTGMISSIICLTSCDLDTEVKKRIDGIIGVQPYRNIIPENRVIN